MKRNSILGVLVLLATILAPPGVVVLASNYGVYAACDSTPASQCIADNGTHRLWYAIAPTARIRTQTTAALHEVYGVPYSYINTSVVTTSGTEDVRVYEGGNFSSSYWAWTYCPSYASKGGSGRWVWCRPQVLFYNNGAHPTRFDSDDKVYGIACHELGHTLGLRHPDDYTGDNSSCMYSVASPLRLDIKSHDEAHLFTLYAPD